jgi:hypothetical protein
MGSQRQLVKNISVASAGRRHYCHSNKRHVLLMGDPIFIVKEGRTPTHYCVSCGLQFITSARTKLDEIDAQLRLV